MPSSAIACRVGSQMPSCDQRVAEVRPREELGRHVADRSHLARVIRGARVDPPLEQPVAHRVGERHVLVVLGRDRGKAGLQAEEIAEEIAPDRIRAGTGARMLVAGVRKVGARGRRGRSLRGITRPRPKPELGTDLRRDLGTRHELRIERPKGAQRLGNNDVAQQHQQQRRLRLARPRQSECDLEARPVRCEQLVRDEKDIDGGRSQGRLEHLPPAVPFSDFRIQVVVDAVRVQTRYDFGYPSLVRRSIEQQRAAPFTDHGSSSLPMLHGNPLRHRRLRRADLSTCLPQALKLAAIAHVDQVHDAQSPPPPASLRYSCPPAQQVRSAANRCDRARFGRERRLSTAACGNGGTAPACRAVVARRLLNGLTGIGYCIIA